MKKGFKVLMFFLFAFVFATIATTQAHADQTGSLLPTADGNYLQWTPSTGTTHYTMVNEATCNGNTNYNKLTNTETGKRDSYSVDLSAVPDNAKITQIDITPCASANSTGGSNLSTMNLFYRANNTDSADAGNYSLSGTTPSVLSATSFTGLSIIKSGTTTLEIGAVYSSGKHGIRLSQEYAVVTYIVPPTAVTNDATNIATNGATLNSTVNPNGNSTSVRYRYGTSNVACSSLPNITSSTNIGSGTTDVSPNARAISSLLNNTVYYFCVEAFNNGGTTDGNVLSFTTLP